MTLSEEAQNHKPKRPMNAYMVFRQAKLAEFADQQDRNQKAKGLWKEIDPKVKEAMEKQYHEDLEQWKLDFAAWKKKYNVSDEDAKKKSKKRKEDTDDDDNKPIKTKGTKETKAAKEYEKKKEEQKKSKSAEKDRAKSKGAGEKDKKKK